MIRQAMVATTPVPDTFCREADMDTLVYGADDVSP